MGLYYVVVEGGFPMVRLYRPVTIHDVYEVDMTPQQVKSMESLLDAMTGHRLKGYTKAADGARQRAYEMIHANGNAKTKYMLRPRMRELTAAH